MKLETFKTKYNTAEKYKPSLNDVSKATKLPEKTEKHQWLTSSQMDVVFKLTNRNLLGSELKNPKFDPEKDQLGRIL